MSTNYPASGGRCDATRVGGDGAGSISSNFVSATSGAANTGGGGGGGGYSVGGWSGGAAGGSGIVVIAYSLAGLTPTLGTPTPTGSGFTVEITNYSATYSWSASSSAGSASVSGSTITVTGLSASASATVTATSSRTGYANTSAMVSGSAKSAQAALTVTSTSGTYGSGVTLSASGGTTSGAVTYTVSAGTASGCAVATGVLSSTSAGTCLVTATMAGDSTYADVSSSATVVTFGRATLTITASSTSRQFGAAIPTITPSYSGFVLTDGSGSLTTPASCTTAYTTTTPVGSVVTSCSGAVSGAGASPGKYSFVYVNGAVTVEQATPNLSWSGISKTYGAAPFALTAPTATGVGGASVAGTYDYSSSDTSVATVASGVVSITGAGSTTLTATFTPTSGNYTSTTVTAVLSVAQSAQATLSITSQSWDSASETGALLFGENYAAVASGGSGTGAITYLPGTNFPGTAGCSITTGTGALTYTSVGECQIKAQRAADANFTVVTSSEVTIKVAKAGQTVDFTSSVPVSPLPNGTYTPTASAISTATGSDSGVTPTFSIRGSSASVCSISGGVVTFLITGSCVIDSDAALNANFTAASTVSQTISVGSLNQNITFTQPPNVAFGSSSVSMSATASSGLTVSYELVAGITACSVSPLGVVTVLEVGTCEVVANAPSNDQYAAASPVLRAFQVLPALATAPTLTSASASSQSIMVGFVSPGFTGGVMISAYQMVATPVSSGTTVTSSSCSASPCTISGLANGTAYTVTVAAINSAGTGAASGATGSLTPATSAFAVGALAATPGSGFVDLTWTALTNDQLGGGTFTRYELSRRVAGTSSWTLVTNALTAQSTSSYTVTGLDNGTSYDFQVVAFTSANASEIPGNTAQVVQYPSTVPSSPRSLVVLASTATEVQFSWAVPLSDGGSALTNPNYTATVTSTTTGATSPVTCSAGAASTNCLASNLTNGALYTFAVVANNRMGASIAASTTYAVPSSDATLSELELSGGVSVPLSPSFVPSTTDYAATVTNTVAAVTVTPTSAMSSSTITVDDAAVLSSEASVPIALSVGLTEIVIEVTATDPRFTETYTITVTRSPAPPVPSGGSGTSAGVPLAPPAIVVNGDVVGAVTVDGNVDPDVLLVRTPANSGWEALGTDFQMSVDTQTASGSPEPLTPAGVMQVPAGGRIVINGDGYLPDSQVSVFAIPRTTARMGPKLLSRAMNGAVYIASTSVTSAGGVSAVMVIPVGMNIGDYILQINGETETLQIRSMNLLLNVVPAAPSTRAGLVRDAAFYEGRSASLSANGRAKLDSMVKAIPVGAQGVSVVIVGVSVGLESLDANLDLARDRAKGIARYLEKQGVEGTYTVAVSTTFTVDGAERSERGLGRASTSLSSFDAPATSSGGKPLTTASIVFQLPTPT